MPAMRFCTKFCIAKPSANPPTPPTARTVWTLICNKFMNGTVIKTQMANVRHLSTSSNRIRLLRSFGLCVVARNHIKGVHGIAEPLITSAVFLGTIAAGGDLSTRSILPKRKIAIDVIASFMILIATACILSLSVTPSKKSNDGTRSLERSTAQGTIRHTNFNANVLYITVIEESAHFATTGVAYGLYQVEHLAVKDLPTRNA
eukprot:CAMPEP_0117500194 /NCGR_PEP_ID=MMETSP0784-20121206/22651_1 /TAXON_ID=39447 /ORGANISM="" /LENGTH=202 /DNA_ID=CAMNT_0005295397 /DNA_START=547 /DNA_END=1155 /DNA_ORIENTATION=-